MSKLSGNTIEQTVVTSVLGGGGVFVNILPLVCHTWSTSNNIGTCAIAEQIGEITKMVNITETV